MQFLNTIGKGWKILAACLTICGSAITGVTFFHDIGGSLSATMNGELLENNETKNFIVFMDSHHVSSCFSALYPTFSNSSNYSIRDFYLKYQLNSTSVQFIPSDYYKIYNEGNNLYTFRYEENVLPGFKSVENPVKETIVSKNGGNMILKAEATYDGCSKPYIYTINVQYIIVPNDENLDFEHWKQKCQQSYHTATSKPTFYLTQNGYIEYTDNINLSAKHCDDTQIYKENLNRGETKSLTEQYDNKQGLAEDSKSLSNSYTNLDFNNQHIHKDEESKFTEISDVHTDHKTNSDFILSVKQYNDSLNNKSYIEFISSDLYPDSIFLICIREECTTNQKISNNVLSIKGSEKRKSTIYNRTTDLKYIDYAVCVENPDLSDSIKVDKHTIYNNTRHTVAVCSEDGHYNFLIAPYKSFTVNSLQFDSIHFRYYNIPQYILSEEYAALTFLPKLNDIKMAAVVGFGIGVGGLILLFLVTIIVNLLDKDYEQIKEDWQDVMKIKSMKFVIFYSLVLASFLVIMTFIVSIINYYNIF